jgi:hypothetical protein
MAKKQLIRLTENDLHKIIKESVKNVLNESCWHGDVKPFEVIYQMADKIVTSLEDRINDENYEEWGDDFRYSHMYEWAKRVRDDSEQYMHCNSQFSPINGGEDW